MTPIAKYVFWRVFGEAEWITLISFEFGVTQKIWVWSQMPSKWSQVTVSELKTQLFFTNLILDMVYVFVNVPWDADFSLESQNDLQRLPDTKWPEYLSSKRYRM